jgi:hypothetical protein
MEFPTMETLNDAGVPAIAEDHHEEIVRIEIEREGNIKLIAIEVEEREDLLDHVRERLCLAHEILIFERGGDLPLTKHPHGRKALRLVGHRHPQILVKVNFEHRTVEATFSPANTVFKVLQWAVGKKGFDLDPMSAARANLILPGAESPLPRESAIGAFTQNGEHTLVVALTLKDFTNG